MRARGAIGGARSELWIALGREGGRIASHFLGECVRARAWRGGWESLQRAQPRCPERGPRVGTSTGRDAPPWGRLHRPGHDPRAGASGDGIAAVRQAPSSRKKPGRELGLLGRPSNLGGPNHRSWRLSERGPPAIGIRIDSVTARGRMYSQRWRLPSGRARQGSPRLSVCSDVGTLGPRRKDGPPIQGSPRFGSPKMAPREPEI